MDPIGPTPTRSLVELNWDCTGAWSLGYWSRRDVTTSLGAFFRNQVGNCRTAQLDFKSCESNSLQVSLRDIVDEARTETGNPYRRALKDQVYPLLTLTPGGEITKNFYPGNLTFPLVWVPPLSNLSVDQALRTEVCLPLRSGFGRVPTRGFSQTTTEEMGEGLVKLTTHFELDSSPRGWFFGRYPTRLRGQSIYLFDRQRGRMLSGQATSELEQPLFLFHFRESWQMKLGEHV